MTLTPDIWRQFAANAFASPSTAALPADSGVVREPLCGRNRTKHHWLFRLQTPERLAQPVQHQ